MKGYRFSKPENLKSFQSQAELQDQYVLHW